MGRMPDCPSMEGYQRTSGMRMIDSGRSRQLAFDLPHLEGLGPGDFLPADSNRQALEAVMTWPNWPSTALVLEGPEGAGKTHLARIWALRASALALTAASVWGQAQPVERLGTRRAAMIDPADEVADERQLLHIYNILSERGGHLLLTASRPLAAWPLRLADLRSRLATAWVVRIEPPCDALLAALLIKQFADRQLRVEEEVIAYLVIRMERSFAAVRRLVDGLDRASLRARRPVRLPLARAVLETLTEEAQVGETEGTSDQGRRLAEWISA